MSNIAENLTVHTTTTLDPYYKKIANLFMLLSPYPIACEEVSAITNNHKKISIRKEQDPFLSTIFHYLVCLEEEDLCWYLAPEGVIDSSVEHDQRLTAVINELEIQLREKGMCFQIKSFARGLNLKPASPDESEFQMYASMHDMSFELMDQTLRI